MFTNFADILVEGAFPAIEYRLAQINVFSHYCLTFRANDCVFSLNERQKVYHNITIIKYCVCYFLCLAGVSKKAASL